MDSTKFKKYAKCSISFHTISYKNHLCSQIRFSTSPFFHVWMTKMLAPAPVSRSRSATFQRPQMSARRRSFHPLLHHRLDVKRHRNRCSAISPSNAYLGMLKNVERVQFFLCSDDFGGGWWCLGHVRNIWGLGKVGPHHPFTFQQNTTTKSWLLRQSSK